MSLAISLIVLVVLFMMAVYISWRAGRLDRLHARLETARASLDAALVRRSSVTLELASSGLFDPATSLLLADCAHNARSALTGRELAESDLTRTLRTVLSQPDFTASIEDRDGADELLGELESTAQQVFIARKFYNDAVSATLAARRRWLARMLRLAGGAPMPEFFEIDDIVAPSGMGEQGTDMPHLAG
jgi:hypothetical protein